MRSPSLLLLPTLGLAALMLAAPAAAQCPGADDSFEDNDDCTTPWALAPGVYPGLYVEKEVSDPDYFQVTVPNGSFIAAVASFTHANGDIDMSLEDLGCVNQLDWSGSTSDDEDVTWLNNTGASVDVVVRVYIYSGAAITCNNYNLDVQVFADPCAGAPDDGFEDNDDCASATIGAEGQFPGLFVSKTDYDYYAYTVPSGSTIDATTFFVHALGDIDLILYDAGACGGGLGTGLAESATVTDDETISYTNNTGAVQNVVLEVNVWQNSQVGCNNYDLDVVITGGTGPIGNNYCGPATLNSSGLSATIGGFGSVDANTNNVRLDATQMATNQFGYFLNSMTQGFVNPPGSQGNLCLGGAIGRYNANVLNTGGTGAFSLQLDLTSTPTPGGPVAIMAGETWNFTCWFRDLNPGQTSNFTDGLTITFL
jgi:hypothetical protein